MYMFLIIKKRVYNTRKKTLNRIFRGEKHFPADKQHTRLPVEKTADGKGKKGKHTAQGAPFARNVVSY